MSGPLLEAHLIKEDKGHAKHADLTGACCDDNTKLRPGLTIKKC